VGGEGLWLRECRSALLSSFGAWTRISDSVLCKAALDVQRSCADADESVSEVYNHCDTQRWRTPYPHNRKTAAVERSLTEGVPFPGRIYASSLLGVGLVILPNKHPKAPAETHPLHARHPHTTALLRKHILHIRAASRTSPQLRPFP